ncbi:MAG: UDP-N-acetylmuramate--alanine ligase [Paludibacteraceae bacterium]|nr:UDP-N-acetylmuramate--alanine ligase [Paludibacteraceae bacterium]
MGTFNEYNHFFFIGVAGTGMSAIAQYLRGIGKEVSGSDRLFAEEKMNIQTQLEDLCIKCYNQDGSGIDESIDVVVISTAIEDSNIELIKARELNIKVIKRSELLASISKTKRTISVGGTSGKSTTTAMIFHILNQCGKSPSLMSGAGLTALQKQGLIGNAYNGKSDWLVIEADESDGSIVNYISEIAVLLNIDRDHKEFSELTELFYTFRANTTKTFIVNQSHAMTKKLSIDPLYDFGVDCSEAGVNGTDFSQKGFTIRFNCNGNLVNLSAIGKHNMENALAAIAACHAAGIEISDGARALSTYEGIYRRTQIVGKSNNKIVIDDFAHNPAEVICAIKSCQNIGKRVIAWFQPHGYGPLKFMHKELIHEVLKTLRSNDLFVLSDVYYAGGTATKEVTSEMVANELKRFSPNILYFANRDEFIPYLNKNSKEGDIILTMGARDPNLPQFAQRILDVI